MFFSVFTKANLNLNSTKVKVPRQTLSFFWLFAATSVPSSPPVLDSASLERARELGRTKMPQGVSILAGARMPAGCWSHIFTFHDFLGHDEIDLRRQCRLFRDALPPLPGYVRVGPCVSGPWARRSLVGGEELICTLLEREDVATPSGWPAEIRMVSDAPRQPWHFGDEADGYDFDSLDAGEGKKNGTEDSDNQNAGRPLLVRAKRLRIVGSPEDWGSPPYFFSRHVISCGVICQSTCKALTIEGVTIGTSRGLAVRSEQSTVVCRRVNISVRQGACVSVQGGSSIEMHSCYVSALDGHGISVIGVGTTASLSNVEIANCRFSGVWAYMGAHATVSCDAKCPIHHCKMYGLHAHGSKTFPTRIDVRRPSGSEEAGINMFHNNRGGDWYEQSPHDSVVFS